VIPHRILPRRAPRALLAVLCLGLAAGCSRPRDIMEPVEGALNYTFPDSSRYVFDAASYAIVDEGVDIGLIDKKRSVVESQWVDIGALRASVSREGYIGADRVVLFRLRTRRVLGGTTLIGEVVYRPAGGGRALEQMVPRDHAGREVLVRMFKSVEDRLIEGREKREREARERPPGTPSSP
jgi:hypothetical protein